jgi:preprotein translocase subunit SecE
MPRLTWASWLFVIVLVGVFLACCWGIAQSA